MNLSKMSSAELASLQEKIAAELVIRKQQDKEQALAKIKDIANESGFSLDELINAKSSRKRSKGEVKYRDPEDPTKTWAGRGRKPKWLESALADGEKLNKFAV